MFNSKLTVLIFVSLFVALCNASLRSMLSQKHGKLGEPFELKREGELTEPPELAKIKLPSDQWFEQKLDHFNLEDSRTWKQRYFVNSTWYKPGGPVFLMIGGEGEASPKWMVSGAWLVYAQNHNALAVQVEHRFYGKSHPLPDLSVASLQYLSSEQALADLAHFITSINARENLPPRTRWIAFGGSYPGSLAAWLRYKYPHLVHGAMSASGPLRAVLDFPEYFQVVSDALATVSPLCVEAVHSATSAVSDNLKSPAGVSYLGEIFKLCKPLDIHNAKDVSSFVESLADNFAGVVQYNKDNRAGSEKVTIDTLCGIMMNKTQKPIERYASVNRLMLNTTKCLDYAYDATVKSMRNESLNSSVSNGARQWMYQTCTEFGFYQTSNQKTHIFGHEFPVDYFTQQCQDIYGPRFSLKLLEEAVDRTNTMYGALDLEVSRVVFVHGSIDPWHALGIYKTRSNLAPAIYINGTAHCANMYPPAETDLPDLKKARTRINHLIGKWLKADYFNREIHEDL